MSPAAGAGSSPGPRWESLGTPDCCVPSPMAPAAPVWLWPGGWSVNTALVGVGLGQVMGPKAACLAEVFCAAQLKKVGGAAVEGCCTAAKDRWPAAHPWY